MRVPHGEGPATRPGLTSCTVAGNGGGEALTGGDAGRVLSRENPIDSGRPTLWSEGEGNTMCLANRREAPRSRAVVDPEHASKLLARKPGDPGLGPAEMAAGSASEGDR